MKGLSAAFISTATFCALVYSTPVIAEKSVTGVPKGRAPITAESPSAPGNGPVWGYNNGPLGLAGAIIAAPFQAIAGGGLATTVGGTPASRPNAQCHMIRYFYGSEGVRYARVCNP
jgi:hypothetical protein